MCKEIKLTYLIFADDLMIFCKGNTSFVNKVMETLDHFSKATGLIANMEKSNIFVAGVEDEIKARKASSSNVVLFSIHSFWGNVFILPQSVVKGVDRLCREYLWGKKEEMRKIILNKESLWVRWVHGVYMKSNQDIWTHSPPSDSSWYWRKLNSVKEGMREWYSQGRYILNPAGEFTGWLATLGKSLTKDRMIGMQIQVENIHCILCNEDALESQDHLFAKCGWITAVRQELNIWTGMMYNIYRSEANVGADKKEALETIQKRSDCCSVLSDGGLISEFRKLSAL
ncbi:uncharacterized protein [Nicotiana sylvestris]|uniref:uncharacterized protein n=1 Tax=Nicotiana sylvestris TaxID=4096 RepID=UPI00388C4666